MKKKKRKVFNDLADKYRGKGIKPACEFFGRCGGCMFQDIAYEEQLLLKKEYLNNLLAGIVQVDEVSGRGPYNYRNRMDFVTAFGKTGLREPGNYRNVVDITSCPIMQEKSNGAFQKVRPLIKEVEGYDYLRHEGYHRYVVIRQAGFTGLVMMNFVVSRPENRLESVIDGIIDDVDSISLILSDGLADLSFGEVIEDIKCGFIEEDFDGIRYRITPNSFFQSNSTVALEMYKRTRSLVKGRVLDLYSGVGSISLFAAAAAERVIGVEQVQEAVDTAEVNRGINAIENVEFICADARKFLRESAGDFDTLVLDPPRSGMNPKMIKHIHRTSPERIVYMSCNPVTFRDNMMRLEGYAIKSFEAYDMFPQTPHVETLALLERK